jgi:hydrogenase nickel incorporation protein HypB
MCATCGCGARAGDARAAPRPPHPGAAADAERQGGAGAGRAIRVERDLLEKNDAIAAANRGWCAARGILLLDLVSSPGAGKTTLLERAIRDLGAELGISVIEGDQATDADAVRIRRAGARATQVNTGTGCHLDAAMVARALRELEPPAGYLVVVENVGNLI